MRFGPIPLERAEGKILGHNIAGPDGQRLLRKGKALSPADIATLRAMGQRSVYVAELEPGDIGEDDAVRALAQALVRHAQAGAQLLILAGETAIMDRRDIVPRAIERANGEGACFGAPVDPGNLLMVAYLGDQPILGAPGCARSRKVNVVDRVLPRLLAGDRLTRADITSLSVGGLLEEISERPRPRAARPPQADPA